MKRTLPAITAALLMLSMTTCVTQAAPTNSKTQSEKTKQEVSQMVNYGSMQDTDIRVESIELTSQWDKVFPLSGEVSHRKVTFVNHFGITLAADLYEPKEYTGKLPALAVCGPFGAVKEQSSGLYAQEMAKRGFLTIAFDPSFTGESGGYPRSFNSPDINVEDYQAAIDFLSVQDNVDPESAAGAAWPFRRRRWIPASKQLRL